MILIADSGGSKTDWALVSTPNDGFNVVLKVRTQGLNPFHQSEDIIFNVLETELKPALKESMRNAELGEPFDIIREVTSVAFYGAGCTADLSIKVGKALSKSFPLANVEVQSDLLGAARATCGHHAGIVCILGTGANSCLYNGNEIVENVPPLGYILGDEGSGAVLGKLFLNGIFKGSLSKEVGEAYLSWSDLTYSDIISKVYRQPLANRYLASISKFIYANLEKAELEELVLSNLANFFEKNIMRYSNASVYSISAVGGVAAAYETQLRKCAKSFGYSVDKVLASPIDGLIDYHR